MEDVMCGKTENQLDAKHTTSEQAWAKATALEETCGISNSAAASRVSAPALTSDALPLAFSCAVFPMLLMRLLPFGTSHDALHAVLHMINAV